MANEILHFQLNTGAKIPSVGLGTWQSEPSVIGQAVEAAIKIGYRHIDCSPSYQNEKEVNFLLPISHKYRWIHKSIFWSDCEREMFGFIFQIGAALKKLFGDGVMKREDLFITSKLWPTDYLPEDVPLALDKTLEDLQLDYVDLYLVHWPVGMAKGSAGFLPENLRRSDIPNTWKAMEALYDCGKAKAIGVSNFSTKKLDNLMSIARIPPAVNQVECHPSWQQPKLRQFCKSTGVHLSGYSPLGSPAWLKSEVLEHPILIATAEKVGRTPAQVALRWALQSGNSVIPKSTNETRIKENFDDFSWSIPDDLFANFFEIQQARLITASVFVHETLGEYKTTEELWDGEI